MEPAFIIRHFAGKVKYQIKVGHRSDGHQKKFLAFSGSLLSGCRKLAGNGLDQKGSQRYFGFALGWCWLEGNPHYYSEKTTQGASLRACSSMCLLYRISGRKTWIT